MTDRDGNVHTYSYDVLGRQTADAVTTLGSGVDGSVRLLTTAYDTGDRPYLFTSYNAASGGSIVNQVEDVYNGLGQLTTEYQSTSGAVNTSSTPKVQYSYNQMSGGTNNSRLVSMTYPNGRVLITTTTPAWTTTSAGLSSISDSTGTLESYSYLGLSTVVIEDYPQPGVELTYVKQTGETNGDAGDQYTGLDRFGRVVDQRWIKTSTGAATDRFQYGYDQDGNVLYRNNLVNTSFGELYHANGSSNGYDNLNRLTNFARGVLERLGKHAGYDQQPLDNGELEPGCAWQLVQRHAQRHGAEPHRQPAERDHLDQRRHDARLRSQRQHNYRSGGQHAASTTPGTGWWPRNRARQRW